MTVKTKIGVADTKTGEIKAYNGETYTQEELELIEKNIENNASFVLTDEASLSNSSASHRLVMETIIDNTRYFFEFDLVTSVSISSNSELTDHPLVSGDMIADHMYRMPATMTVSGKFALQGNKRYPYEGAGERLANIENLFERIKNEGITSTLLTMYGNEQDSARFKIRENMALVSISWTEFLNSLEFTFEFHEVLQADVQEVEYDVDITDPNLPALTDASSLNFTDSLLDWEEVDKVILKKLVSIEAVTSDFLQEACNIAKNTAVGFATGLAVGATIGFQVLVGILAVCGSIPVYGWIAAAVIVAVCAIAAGIVALFKAIKNADERKKYKIKQYKLYKDDRRNQQEVEEFANYLGNIHQNLQYLNDVIQVYSCSSNQNQECMTYIDDNYYIFRFMKNNTTNVWTLTVLDIENNVQGTIANCNASALGSIAECTRTNAIFRTKGGGFYIYLINKEYEALANNCATEEQFKKAQEDLRNYYIVVSQTDMEKFNQMLSDIVLNAMKM